MTRSEPDPLVSGRANARGEPRITLRLDSASDRAAGLLARRALDRMVPLYLDFSSDSSAALVSGGVCLSRGTSSTRY